MIILLGILVGICVFAIGFRCGSENCARQLLPKIQECKELIENLVNEEWKKWTNK